MSSESLVTKPAERKRLLWNFALEAVLYSAVVGAYAALVLRYGGQWLKDLFDHHLRWYSVVALVVIVGQGVVLEAVTTLLFQLVRRWTR